MSVGLLPVTVLVSLIVSFPDSWNTPPALSGGLPVAVLPVIVDPFCRMTLPPDIQIPPPDGAVFPSIVAWFNSNVPPSLATPPPRVALLPLISH